MFSNLIYNMDLNNFALSMFRKILWLHVEWPYECWNTLNRDVTYKKLLYLYMESTIRVMHELIHLVNLAISENRKKHNHYLSPWKKIPIFHSWSHTFCWSIFIVILFVLFVSSSETSPLVFGPNDYLEYEVGIILPNIKWTRFAIFLAIIIFIELIITKLNFLQI